jgi:hypothetical protein
MIPAMTDPAQVTADPVLGLLSLVHHGEEAGVCAAFLEGTAKLPGEHGEKYSEYGWAISPAGVKRIMEALMASTNWPVYTPFAKKHFGEGKAEGQTEGKAEAVSLVLAARGIEVSDDQRARIDDCSDAVQLSRWVSRAAVAASAAELFEC